MSDSSTGTKKVIVVEDETIIAEDVARTLRGLGYEVPAVLGSGEEAVAEVARLKPDLVIMDISMPGRLDGIEAAARIAETRDIPVVFLTAYSDDATLQRAKTGSPFGYIVKPYARKDIRTGVEIALYKHGMEKALRESNAKYEAILDATPDLIFRLRRDGSFVDKILDQGGVCDAYPGEAGAAIMKAVETASTTRLLASAEYRYAVGGADRWFEMRVVPLADDELLAVVRDVSDRRRSLQLVQESEGRLREHNRLLHEAREQEREEIAREIHDELGQLLVGLKMEAAGLLKASPPESPVLSEGCRAMMHSLDGTIEEVRRITNKLHPLALRDLGFAAAAQWLKQDFERRTAIRCRLTCAGDIRIDVERATVAFRVLQEALTNAARHSGAGQVSIAMKMEGGTFVLSVRDNGKGFEPAASGGRGIEGMRARAAAFGGSVTVTGVVGKGAMVTLLLPVKEGDYDPDLHRR